MERTVIPHQYLSRISKCRNFSFLLRAKTIFKADVEMFLFSRREQIQNEPRP